MKVCRKCGVELVVGDNWYQSAKKKNDYICIECHKARCKQRYKENPTKNRLIICRKCGKEKRLYAKGFCGKCYKEEGLLPIVTCIRCGEEKPHFAQGMCQKCYGRQWREDSFEYNQERARQWRKDNHEYALERSRQYYHSHKEEASASQREWRKAHREERKEYMRQWHKEHREEQREYRRQYCEEHREEIAKQHRQYLQERPEIAHEYNHRRRARLLNATIEPVNEQKIRDLYNHTCLYCGNKDNPTLDHVVPLNSGGAHSEDNLVIACGSCNSSKRDRPLFEWLHTQPYSQAWVM